MKFLVTGLGNPGFDYTNTRHNIGFKVLDSIAESMSQDFEICRYGLISKIKYKGKTLILLKPNCCGDIRFKVRASNKIKAK